MSLRLTNEVSICWATFSGHLLRILVLLGQDSLKTRDPRVVKKGFSPHLLTCVSQVPHRTNVGHLNILSKEYIMAKRRKDNPVAIKYLRKKQRRAEKSKVIPFHIAHNYKSYVLTDGTVFWARDDEMAEDYRQFVGDIEQ